MSQADIIECLQAIRKESNGWLSLDEVMEKMKERYGYDPVAHRRCVRNDLYKLSCFGMIQVKGEGVWRHRKLFRGVNGDG